MLKYQRRESGDGFPAYGRVKDVIKYFGIPRTRVYELINERKISSCVDKKPGKARGIRLINMGSVDDYLRGLGDS